MSAIGIRAFVFGVAALVVVGLGTSLRPSQGAEPTNSLLGTGSGLDHVIVIVRDLDRATRDYKEVLGFTDTRGGKFPGGLESRALKFSDNYVELMSIDSLQAPPGDDLVRLLRKREGGYALGLNVSSAQQAADSLRARHFEVVGPMSMPVISEGSKEARPAPWQTVAITSPELPFEPFFFIQYPPREAESARYEHPNTAADLHSAWIAVKDLETATRGYEALGLPIGQERRIPQLAAKGREIGAGQGVILLLEATDPGGPVASHVAEQGEGVIGMSIRVRDLDVARSLLRNSTRESLDAYSGPYGRSILVSPAFTHGVWIEFFQ